MTGWGVERKPRTAHPTSLLSTGDSSLMPPHSQGAERRTERRAGRTGSRWALRALVIGGLAGAVIAGLLGSAAGSIVGSAVGGVLDDNVFDNHRCLSCGHTFGATLH